MSGILRLESLTKGNTLKQGDKTPLKYRLFDADGEKLNIAGKSARVRFVNPDISEFGYEKDGLTVAQDDTVTFIIDKAIPPKLYYVEIIVDEKFIFPSRADEAKFSIDKSSVGIESNIIEIVGLDSIVERAVDSINNDPSLLIDEDKLLNNVIANTGLNNIDEYYQQFNDVIIELSEEKDYHSLPEIAGARGGHDTLGQRLDETTAQLTQITSRTQITPDDFEGTDAEKLQQVLDYAIENNKKIIELKRAYDITGSTIYLPTESWYKQITFIGGEIIKNDEGFVFSSLAVNNSRNAPQFQDTFLTTTGDNVYLFDGDRMIRPNATRCFFKRMGLIKTTGYIQTLRLYNCETTHLGCDFIVADNCFDFLIEGGRFESSITGHSLVNIVTNKANGISYFGLRIVDALIEGYTVNSPLILGAGNGLKIDGNYFEANKVDITFRHSAGTNLIAGVINNNSFGDAKGDFNILFEGTFVTTRLSAEGNTSTIPPRKYFSSLNFLKNFDTSNNFNAGGSFAPLGTYSSVKGKSYASNQIDMSPGVKWEVPLHLKLSGDIYNQNTKQYLINAKMNFGSSVYYTGHLTGIMSIDGFWSATANAVVQGLNLTIISERNTGGQTNGNLKNPPSVNYYFKESGTKEISSSAKVATLVIEFPEMVYGNRSNLSVKPLADLIIEYARDN